MKKAAIYIRDISNNEENIIFQIEKAKEFVEKNNLTIYKIFIDRDNSSEKMNEMLEDVSLKVYDVVLIESIDQFLHHELNCREISSVFYDHDIIIDKYIILEMVCELGNSIIKGFENLTEEIRKTNFLNMKIDNSMDEFVSNSYIFYLEYKNRYIDDENNWKY
jgi:hypothetical protein